MALKVVYLNDWTDIDPAQKVLLEEEEAKKRRRQEETKIELERIQNRITFALSEYEHEDDSSDATQKVVSFERLKEPQQLYELLADSQLRSKYERHLTIILMGVDQQKEQQQKILHSLEDFFEETRAGNTELLIQEVAEEEVDFSEATSGIESALSTAVDAAGRLVQIKTEIGHLLSIMAQFSGDKKGRRKLEKSLIKTQEEVKALVRELEGAKQELQKSSSQCIQLQKSLELKKEEIDGLKKTAKQHSNLEQENKNLRSELSDMKSSLSAVRDKVKQLEVVPKSKSDVGGALTTKLQQALTESELARENISDKLKAKEEELQTMTDTLQSQHKEELNKLHIEYQEKFSKAQLLHQEELEETREHHQEQLRSLMVDTEPFNEEEEEQQYFEVEEQKEEPVSEEASCVITPALLVEESRKVVDVTPTYKLPVSNLETESEVLALKAELQLAKDKNKKQSKSFKARLLDADNKLEILRDMKNKETLAFKTDISDLQDQISDLNEEIMSLKQSSMQQRSQCETHVSQIQALESALQHYCTQQKTDYTQQLESTIPLITQEKEITDHSTQWSLASGSGYSAMFSLISQQPTASPLQASSLSNVNSVPLLLTSAPLSPNYQGLVSDHPLPGMASSHLSRGDEEQPLTSLASDSPIVIEWCKLYDAFRKFSDHLISKLAAIGKETEGTVICLKEVKLDPSKDISTQITEMRFTLSLAIHQLQNILSETFIASDAEEEGGVSSTQVLPKINSSQQLRTDQLKHQLKSIEDRHKQELTESRDIITSLSLKIDSLKGQIAQLNYQLRAGEKPLEDTGVTFFTELDKQRNERSLQEAVNVQQLSLEESSELQGKMEEYVSLPSQRLARLSHRLLLANQAKNAQQMAGQLLQPRHAERVIGILHRLEKKHEEEFGLTMANLSTRRQLLSENLRTRLTKVEKTAGVFLIKPTYPSTSEIPQPLITPINRTPPASEKHSPVLSKRSRPVTTQGYLPHPIISHPPPHYKQIPSTITSSNYSREDLFNFKKSHGESWIVENSRAPSVSQASCQPVVPHLLELETVRMREPKKLLGKVMSGHVTSVPASYKRRLSHDRSLPPIHIPLNANQVSPQPIN